MTEESVHPNELPTAWLRAAIFDLLQATETRNPRKCGSGQFEYVDIDAIDNTVQRVTRPKSIDNAAAPSRARRSIKQGDVLISLVRPYLRNIAIVPAELNDQIASTAFCVCRAASGIEPRYLFHYLCQPRFIQTIPTYGDSPPAAHDDEFLALDIPVPPTAEQARIADRIDELFSDLDSGVEALRRVRRKLDRYRAAVLHAAVTGRLSARWREEHDPDPAADLLARILKTRREHWEADTLRKYEAKGKTPPKGWRERYREPDTPRLRDRESLPTGWTWTTAEQITQGDRPSAYGVLKPGPETPDGIPLVRVGDIDGGRVATSGLKRIGVEVSAPFARTVLRGGELLLTLVGSIGRTAVVPPELAGANTARAVGVIPLSAMVNAEFVERWFRNPSRVTEMTLKSHEVARKTLNLEDVRSTLVALPPHTEQQYIVDRVQEEESRIDSLIAEVDRALRRSGRLRQSILKAAFEGKLVPQDPTDEPASVLLTRLRSQAESGTTQGTGRRRRTTSENTPEGQSGVRKQRNPATDDTRVERRR